MPAAPKNQKPSRKRLRLTKPSPHVIGPVLKSAKTLRGLCADCLARKKARPKFQLQLDQSVVEFVLMCKEARTLARRLSILESSLPKFS
ncbi:hypothetical protein PC120_g15048 [Phytophthora cactorum]|nr:hypothetical protein PC120_g15048 [Phytophthora cactorum]